MTQSSNAGLARIHYSKNCKILSKNYVIVFLLETGDLIIGLQNKGYFGLIINKEQPTMIFFYKIESYFMDLLGEKGSYLLDDNLSKQPL